MTNTTSPADDESDEVLDSRKLTLRIAGRELTLTPITLAEMPAIARAARPVFAFLRDMDRTSGEDFIFDLFDLHTHEMVALIAPCARVETDWLITLSLDDAARIGEAVIRLNQDFFIRRLLPMLGAIRTAGAPATGATPSSGSSQPDSGTAT